MKMKTERQKKLKNKKKPATKMRRNSLAKAIIIINSNQRIFWIAKANSYKQFKFVIVLCLVLSCEKVVPNADLWPLP